MKDQEKLSAAERAQLERVESHWAIVLENRRETPRYREALARITADVDDYLARAMTRRRTASR